MAAGRTELGQRPWDAELALRLEESAAAVEGYFAAHRDELEVRDRLIIEAVDRGYPHARIARLARVTPPRIIQIIARRCAEAG